MEFTTPKELMADFLAQRDRIEAREDAEFTAQSVLLDLTDRLQARLGKAIHRQKITSLLSDPEARKSHKVAKLVDPAGNVRHELLPADAKPSGVLEEGHLDAEWDRAIERFHRVTYRKTPAPEIRDPEARAREERRIARSRTFIEQLDAARRAQRSTPEWLGPRIDEHLREVAPLLTQEDRKVLLAAVGNPVAQQHVRICIVEGTGPDGESKSLYPIVDVWRPGAKPPEGTVRMVPVQKIVEYVQTVGEIESTMMDATIGRLAVVSPITLAPGTHTDGQVMTGSHAPDPAIYGEPEQIA